LDELLSQSCVLGFEEGDENNETFWINNAICGAEKENLFIIECMDALLQKFDGTDRPIFPLPG